MYHEQASPVRNGYVCVCMYAQGAGRVVGGELVVDNLHIVQGIPIVLLGGMRIETMSNGDYGKERWRVHSGPG